MAEVAVVPESLPVGSKGRHASGWWGMLAIVATEAALFAYLLFSYYYLAAQAHGPWPPEGIPPMRIALPDTFILIAASVTVWWGDRGIKAGDTRRLLIGLVATLVLGAVFLGLQVLEWTRKTFTPTTDVYGSLYFTVTGFHMAHVLVGLVMIATLAAWTGMRYFGRERHAAVTIGAIYWHFVTVVWLAVFATFYLVPRWS